MEHVALHMVVNMGSSGWLMYLKHEGRGPVIAQWIRRQRHVLSLLTSRVRVALGAINLSSADLTRL